MLRRLISSRAGKLGVAGAIVLALSAPALADHIDFDDLEEGQEVTAEDLHVDCGELDTEECDALVQESFEELQNYDHPENHGKYVSYLAHCISGSPEKGPLMSQIAQANGDEDSEELAVTLCAQWKADQDSAEEDELGTLSGKPDGKPDFAGKGKPDFAAGDDDVEDESEDENEVEVTSEKSGKANGKGNGKGKGRRGPPK